MGTLVAGRSKIPYEFRRSPRARNIRISVGPDGVEVVAPRRASRREVEDFVVLKADWIQDKLRSFEELSRLRLTPSGYETGDVVPHRGRELTLWVMESVAGDSSVVVDDLQMLVTVAAVVSRGRRAGSVRDFDRAERVRLSIDAWVDRTVLEDARRVERRFRSRIGRRPKGFRVRRQRARWGSCAADGTIYLNARLIAAPREVLDYVVVHELCHLRHPNHSRAYWTFVESLVPDYRGLDAWLTRHGVALSLS